MGVTQFKPRPEPEMERRNFSQPDEVRRFELGKVEIVVVEGTTLGRAVFQPGWRWSTCVKPIANTESCQVPHLNLHISGRLHVRMDDGSEREFAPGDVGHIPPGHDAWVIGEEPVVVIDISGMQDYAKGL